MITSFIIHDLDWQAGDIFGALWEVGVSRQRGDQVMGRAVMATYREQIATSGIERVPHCGM